MQHGLRMMEKLAKDVDCLLDACLFRESVSRQKCCHISADGWRVVEHWILTDAAFSLHWNGGSSRGYSGREEFCLASVLLMVWTGCQTEDVCAEGNEYETGSVFLLSWVMAWLWSITGGLCHQGAGVFAGGRYRPEEVTGSSPQQVCMSWFWSCTDRCQVSWSVIEEENRVSVR